ncbi:DUF1345 domain-containing protein [Tessaracoccus defluvii]|uniref:DUF1345 domain-containing protein n=1 Tax=Tessaracoccus defluvii TaxID=1285901 RepID=A0A7H0H564_9ACTN|nr:DUF1345 domain-containing protein [Tessaracoccus defluvii]QNP55680.1 DUF1345 domain-containing protein [Tessaracoccus defluvii]
MTRRSRRLFRLTLSVAVGVAVMLLVGLTARIDLGIAAGWATFVAVYCTWTWARLWPLDAVRTAEHSREEDPGRGLADVILIVASIASVAGMGFVLVAGDRPVSTAALGVACVVASWVLVHTIYGIRYADLYFSSPEPPIDFGDEPPRYSDFAYLTFCLGMTFQISDTNLRTNRLRVTVLGHTLLSYFLGAVVLAATVNLVSGLAAS